MVDEREICSIVLNQVKKIDINNGDYNSLPPRIQEQLFKIETYIQETIYRQKEIAAEIKQCKLNANNAIKQTGISRGSFYNHTETLMKYFEERKKYVDSLDILSLQTLERQRTEIEILRDHYENLKNQLIAAELLEYKISDMEEEIRSLILQRDDKIASELRLLQENNQLKSKLRSVGVNNVVPL